MIDLTGKVLVVVDMQPGYAGSMTPGVIEAVELLIREAVEADSLVVFLEFADDPTLPCLLRHVYRYDQFVIEPKFGCDGSEEVLAACARGLYDTSAFVICGVETHACVRDTARELAAKMPGSTVEVVKEACGQESGNHWNMFPRARNLRAIHLGHVPAHRSEQLEVA
jgi:nicotinamidase-related amidase